MSQDGQCLPCGEDGAALTVVTFTMPPGAVFDWHTHTDHQLAWAASGVLTVRSKDAAWILPPTRALWIPAGVQHETLTEGASTMRTVYLEPDQCAITWRACTPVTVTALMAELIGLLETTSLEPQPRSHAETLLVDLLVPVRTVSFEVRMPVDPRALQVATSIELDPTDGRSLAAWGNEVGASDRTLARTFLADTGMPFGRWRAMIRLRRAVGLLAIGESVASVARQVGYESVSAFVAAFRRETGMTPSAYFHHERAQRVGG